MSNTNAETALRFITEGLQQLIDARLEHVYARLALLEKVGPEIPDDIIDKVINGLEGSPRFTDAVMAEMEHSVRFSDLIESTVREVAREEARDIIENANIEVTINA
jgi:hypothetical protein